MHIPRFPGQKEGEKVEVVLRKHWIVHFNVLLFVFIFGVIPFSIYSALFLNFRDDFFSEFMKIFSSFFMVYLLYIILFAYIKWLNEELDVVIITNERIISVNQIRFLSREVSETSLIQIQDVKERSHGLFSTIFDYGTIEIQTAADNILFQMHHVPRPVIYVRNILDLKDRHRAARLQGISQKVPNPLEIVDMSSEASDVVSTVDASSAPNADF